MALGNQAIAQTFTTAQTDTVLVPAGVKSRAFLTGCIITAHGDNTLKPRVCVKLGPDVVIEHPGVPPGGGLAIGSLDIMGAQGDDITVTSQDPGGSLAITVQYRTE